MLTEVDQSLRFIFTALTLMLSVRVLRDLGWRSCAALVILALSCAEANPAMGRHLRTVRRDHPDINVMREPAVYHDLLFFSAVSLRHEVISIGWLGQVLVMHDAPP